MKKNKLEQDKLKQATKMKGAELLVEAAGDQLDAEVKVNGEILYRVDLNKNHNFTKGFFTFKYERQVDFIFHSDNNVTGEVWYSVDPEYNNFYSIFGDFYLLYIILGAILVAFGIYRL